MRNWQKQLIKFGLIGVLNTAVDFGVFNVLIFVTGIHAGWGAGLINMFAVTVAAINSYFLNRNWTFMASTRERHLQFIRFGVATAFGMLINSLTVVVVAEEFSTVLFSTYVILNGGKVLGAIFSATSNFLLYRTWVFREDKQTSHPVVSWMPGMVSVIIPAYNELQRLPSRLRELATSLPYYFPAEIVVVDDGSTDGTAEAVRKIAYEYPWVRCLGYAENQGKGAAVQKGMLAAYGEFLVFTDADNTFTVGHIARMVAQLQRGAKVAIGVRQQMDGERLAGESRLRQLAGRCFNYLVQAVALPGIEDTQCGLKGFHREAAQAIFTRQRLKGFAFDVEILALARALKYEIVPVALRAKDCPGSRVRLLSPLQMCGEIFRHKLALFFNRYALPGGGVRAREAGLLLGLFGLAFAVRLPWLWQVPRFIDELREVYLGYMIYLGKMLPLHNMARDIGAMHNYILAGIFKILGPGAYWPRLYVALTSAATVPLFYLLGKKLFGKKVGLLAAGLLLTNGMHILVTHMAWANSTTPFYFTMAMLCTLKAEEKKSGKWLVVAGLMWALVLQTHSSVAVYLLVLLAYLLRPAFRRATGIGWQWFIAGLGAFLLGYANMIYYNLISRGGSFRWITQKTYTVDTDPTLTGYVQHLMQMTIELVRAISSTYVLHVHWQEYFFNLQFVLALCLLGFGMYLALRKGRNLPAWMIIGGFLTIPWINTRYGFFLATRYIMPIILCSLLIVAYAIVTFLQRIKAPARGRKFALVTTVVMLILIAVQLVPFYGYCIALHGTNLSNELSFETLAAILRSVPRDQSVILLDKSVDIENDPLPYLLTLSKQDYEKLPGDFIQDLQTGSEEWLQNLKKHTGDKFVAVVTQETYEQLRDVVMTRKVNQFTCKVTLNAEKPNEVRNIYVIEFLPGQNAPIRMVQKSERVRPWCRLTYEIEQ